MNICVIGTGYVGLVTGACLADFGHQVTCVDVDERRLRMLEAGEVPFYEPGLGEIVTRNTAAKRLSFTRDLGPAVANSLVVFLAVGTPEGENGEADLSYVMRAAEQIGQAMDSYRVIVTKSTVPIGTKIHSTAATTRQNVWPRCSLNRRATMSITTASAYRPKAASRSASATAPPSTTDRPARPKYRPSTSAVRCSCSINCRSLVKSSGALKLWGFWTCR